MSNASESAGPEVGTQKPAKAAHPRRRRLKSLSTEWADLQDAGLGLFEISKINVKADVSMEDLQLAGEEEQGAVGTYFTTPVDIFISKAGAARRTGFLRRVFLFLDLWPPALEERLAIYDEKRFGTSDRDIRGLIDVVVDLFEVNLWRYMTLKRFLQFLVIFATWLGGAAALSAFLVFSPGLNPLVILAALAGLGVLSFASLWGYKRYNAMLFKRYYLPALKNSVDLVSRPISDRMRSLSSNEERYIQRIDSIMARGEPMGEETLRKNDEDLKDGHSYLWMQMMLWLPVRALGIETFLRNRMESAEKTHAIYDGYGFLLTGAIFLLFAIPALAALVYCVSMVALHPAAHTLDTVAGALIAGFTLWFAFHVSIQSYYNPDWNAAKHILEFYFDTSDWNTFAKRKLDTRLAARLQRAMGQIDHLNKQLGHTK